MTPNLLILAHALFTSRAFPAMSMQLFAELIPSGAPPRTPQEGPANADQTCSRSPSFATEKMAKVFLTSALPPISNNDSDHGHV